MGLYFTFVKKFHQDLVHFCDMFFLFGKAPDSYMNAAAWSDLRILLKGTLLHLYIVYIYNNNDCRDFIYKQG
jgi:hypothetical protein